MLHHIEEFGVYAEITGFKGVKFSDAEAFLKESPKESPTKLLSCSSSMQT